MLQTMNVDSTIGSVELLAHPRAASSVSGLCVEANLMRVEGALVAQYTVSGNVATLRVPEQRMLSRRDELWRHTCAELFVAGLAQSGYYEFNFSPSTEWAAYQFDSYRAGMRPVESAAPAIKVWHDAHVLRLTAQCTLPTTLADATRLQVGITMVLEDVHGGCSYWALKHPSEKPDFHDRDSFVLEL